MRPDFDLQRDDDLRRLRLFLRSVSGHFVIDESSDTSDGGTVGWCFDWTERRLLASGGTSVFLPVEIRCHARRDGTLHFKLQHRPVGSNSVLASVQTSIPPLPWGASVHEARRMLDEHSTRLLDQLHRPMESIGRASGR